MSQNKSVVNFCKDHINTAIRRGRQQRDGRTVLKYSARVHRAYKKMDGIAIRTTTLTIARWSLSLSRVRPVGPPESRNPWPRAFLCSICLARAIRLVSVLEWNRTLVVTTVAAMMVAGIATIVAIVCGRKVPAGIRKAINAMRPSSLDRPAHVSGAPLHRESSTDQAEPSRPR
jgi:hypothetical protein